MTLTTAITQWMEVYKKDSIKTATYDRMITSLDLMAKFPIADTDIRFLTSKDIQNYVNALVDKGYAQTTIKKQFNLVSGYLRFAVATGEIKSPIQQAVVLPSQSLVKKPKREIKVYTLSQQTRLKTACTASQNHGALASLFMMETGMRAGEVLALEWTDIQLQRRAVRIDKTLVRLANQKESFVQNSAKSFASNRTIPLSSEAIRILSLLDRKTKYVFGENATDHYSYEAMRYQTMKMCKECGVEYLGMHVFRHTFATNCYHKGCDVKILSKLLGHSSVSVTYNTYIHLYGDALEEMRSILD